MTTRREFMLQSAAAGLCLPAGIAVARDGLAESPIKRVILRDDTVLRKREVDGGLESITWASNGLQYAAFGDVVFVPNPVKDSHARTFSLSGDAKHSTFEDLPNYPDMLALIPDDPRGSASYWPTGSLAVDGTLYQYLMTANHPYTNPDMTFPPDFRMTGVKLIYSPDSGRTWRNQDGSSPVVWEKWAERSRENMVFWDEKPVGAFTGGFNPISMLQMGKGYELNKDGYVYGYSFNGIDKPAEKELVCFRVSKSHILDRRSYEFFAGMRSDGSANWTQDISARAAVHTFPDGPVPNGSLPGQMHSGSWAVAAFYNEPLRRFMFAGLRWGIDAEGRWFTKPSYLGLWTAPTPWGPFTQVHEEASWTPGHDSDARIATIAVPPKWIAADGKSFWIAWSDYSYKGDDGGTFNPDADVMPRLKGIADKPEGARVALDWDDKHMRYSCFSAMRVDIVL